MKIGVFGGSFDPVHNGHLLLAEFCRDLGGLDRILFMPTAHSPLKSQPAQATDLQRIEMLKLAIGGNRHFELSSWEIDRGGISFTVDTLAHLNSVCSDAELFLLIGADSLSSFSRWKQPKEICELAIPLVASRRGHDSSIQSLAPMMTQERYRVACQHQVQLPIIEISSTEIRADVSAGRSIRYRTPRSVEKYIETHRLYSQDVSGG